MIEQDTIRLLRECDAGIKMGVSSLEEIVSKAENEHFKALITESIEKHQRLKEELQKLLDKYHDDGKEPAALAKGMSWIKTSVKIAADESDHTIADLITDGCNMGVKSLCRYLNQYQAADEKSKDIAKQLVKIEENLALELRAYL